MVVWCIISSIYILFFFATYQPWCFCYFYVQEWFFMYDLCTSMKFMRLAYRCYKCLGYAHRLSWKIVFCTTVSHGLRHKPSDGHDGVIKWKHFPHRWPFVWGIHRSPMNSPHKGQWRFDIFFDLSWSKRLSKQSRRWWFETPSRSLWRHCNGNRHNIFSSSADKT